MIRVAFVTELPTPYRIPLFERIQDLEDVRVEFLFMTRSESDRSWTVDVSGLRHKRFLRGHALEWKGKRSIIYHVNPGIFHALRTGRYDVVTIAGYSMFTSQASLIWCRWTGTPYLLFGESHHQDRRAGWVRWIKGRVLPAVVRPAAGILATGTLSTEYFVSYGADPERVYRFANTPDVERLREENAKARPRRAATLARLGIPESACVLLFVGRLIEVKGVADLVRAAASLDPESARVLVVGDGPEDASLRALADRVAPGRVVFAGFREGQDLTDLYGAADVFVLPSHHEPWGVVVGEAMACGLPVVLSDRIGAGTDLLEEGRNGYGFPSGDVAALGDALGRMVADSERREAMGAASNAIMDDWTYDASVRGFERAVRQAAESRV
jgi:glycosyltransferase involved in cell wall biosynthesis